MKATRRFLIRVALISVAWLVLAGSPAVAQQPGSRQQERTYIPLETQTTTYTWLVVGVMLAGTMVIAFKKPKRAASR